MDQQEITVSLEVSLSDKHHSFEATIRPGSYVSELIGETLEQCDVSGLPPQRCQLFVVSETSSKKKIIIMLINQIDMHSSVSNPEMCDSNSFGG